MVDLTPFLPGLSPVQGKAVVARFDGRLSVLCSRRRAKYAVRQPPRTFSRISPSHLFCRSAISRSFCVFSLTIGNCDDPAFDTPELVRRYIDLFTRAAAQSRKPHYLLHSRPGVMDRALVAQLRERGIAVASGLREGLSAIDRLARLTSRGNS